MNGMKTKIFYFLFHQFFFPFLSFSSSGVIKGTTPFDLTILRYCKQWNFKRRACKPVHQIHIEPTHISSPNNISFVF